VLSSDFIQSSGHIKFIYAIMCGFFCKSSRVEWHILSNHVTILYAELDGALHLGCNFWPMSNQINKAL